MSSKKTSVADQAAKLEKHINEGKSKVNVKAKSSTKKKAASKNKAASKKKTSNTKVKTVNAIVGKTELLKVNPHKLLIDWDDNPRIDYGNMKTLEASIKTRGVENPIRVIQVNANGELKLEAGYRRVRACLNLADRGEKKITSIPAILEKKGTNGKETLIHVFVENDGKLFNAMEEAVLFQEMKDIGMAVKDIAKSIGRSRSVIVNKINLLKVSIKLQDALRGNIISLLTAQRIISASKKDHKKQDKLLSEFLKKIESGAKKDIKQANSKIAKDAGIRRNTSGITQHKAKKLLDEIAMGFTTFARSQKPANKLNKSWVDLETKLKKVRSLKRKGQFK